ncbi:MAG: HAD-IB family phosphatase [Candidatus Pacebacteria bacterium]|nr:HAD-IB family phosphatase [Candidatus Paceibacterota bacterium]
MNGGQKTLILDLDGTVTKHSTWKILNTALGITPDQDDELFQQYYQGKLSYLDWTKQLIELYRSNNSPLTREHILKLAEDVELRPDAISFVQAAKENGYFVILVSGSVDVIVEHIANKLGTDQWLSCSKAIFENDTLIDIVSMGDEGPAKLKLVTYAGIELSANIVSVGDGANEKELFERTRGILLGNSQTLLPLAWRRVDTLTEAIELI